MTEKLHVDWKFASLTLLIFAAPGVLRLLDLNPRVVGWQLAALATGLLFWRLLGWFHETPTGMRVASVLLIISLLLGAIGQFLATTNNTPITWVTEALVVQRMLCIVYAIYWPRWTDTKVSPFIREKN